MNITTDVKNKIIDGFIEEIKKFKLEKQFDYDGEEVDSSEFLVNSANRNFIKLNNYTIDDINNYIKKRGSINKYSDFIDFFIEFYSTNFNKISKKYISEDTEITPFNISFIMNEGNIITINY